MTAEELRQRVHSKYQLNITKQRFTKDAEVEKYLQKHGLADTSTTALASKQQNETPRQNSRAPSPPATITVSQENTYPKVQSPNSHTKKTTENTETENEKGRHSQESQKESL